MNKYVSNEIIRVNKTVARKLYNQGFDVGLCPCKANPESPWGLMVRFNKHDFDYSFDYVCNYFALYKCNSGSGKYPAYYVDKYTYIHFTFKDGSNPYYFRGSAVDCLKEIKKWSNDWTIEGGESHYFELKQKRLQ